MKLEDILGKSIDDPTVAGFLASIPEKHEAMPDVGREYRSYKRSGIELAFDEGTRRIFVVFLHNRDSGTYRGVLPRGVQFSMNRAEVRRAVGRGPDASKDGNFTHDTWEEGTHQFRVEYTPDRSAVKMVVLQT